MKLSALKSEKKVEVFNSRELGIQAYGENNDYPQLVSEIVEGSISGTACLDTYQKFVFGKGLMDKDLGDAVVNSRGETLNDVVRDLSHDLTKFGGFALHLNYNYAGDITSIASFPFECLRLGAMNDEGKVHKIAYHKDWGKRDVRVKKFDKSNIIFYDLYNPDVEVVRRQARDAGGWAGYSGQILYFSTRGKLLYPSPVYAPALTDMSSEEGLSNIMLRNVRHNFLTAGMFIDYDNTANSDEQMDAMKNELKEFQGDNNAGKILYVNLRNGEQEPKFVSFNGENYDKAFSNAESLIPVRIGQAFRQPAVLRGMESANGFDTQRIRQAYTFYNSLTENERHLISEKLEEVLSLFERFELRGKDCTIEPKSYEVEKVDVSEKTFGRELYILAIINDKTISSEQRRLLLSRLYGFTDEDTEVLC